MKTLWLVLVLVVVLSIAVGCTAENPDYCPTWYPDPVTGAAVCPRAALGPPPARDAGLPIDWLELEELDQAPAGELDQALEVPLDQRPPALDQARDQARPADLVAPPAADLFSLKNECEDGHLARFLCTDGGGVVRCVFVKGVYDPMMGSCVVKDPKCNGCACGAGAVVWGVADGMGRCPRLPYGDGGP